MQQLYYKMFQLLQIVTVQLFNTTEVQKSEF